jgi:hypothetical protein
MVAEMALAHSVGTETERAYLRSDLQDLRRTLMTAWGIVLRRWRCGEQRHTDQEGERAMKGLRREREK